MKRLVDFTVELLKEKGYEVEKSNSSASFYVFVGDKKVRFSDHEETDFLTNAGGEQVMRSVAEKSFVFNNFYNLIFDEAEVREWGYDSEVDVNYYDIFDQIKDDEYFKNLMQEEEVDEDDDYSFFENLLDGNEEFNAYIYDYEKEWRGDHYLSNFWTESDSSNVLKEEDAIAFIKNNIINNLK